MLRLLGVLMVALPVAPPLLAAERPEATPDAPQRAAEAVYVPVDDSVWFWLCASVPWFFLAASVFWIWMLLDAIKHCPGRENLKLVWVLVILLTNILGAVLYAIVQRPRNPPAST